MNKLFDRWFFSSRVALALVDLVCLILAVLLSMFWLHRKEPVSLMPIVPSALAFAAAMVTVSASLGIYSVKCGRNLLSSTIRNAISLAVAIPVAYLMFEFRPTQVSTVISLALLALFRTYVVHADAGKVLARRIMIAGTGAEALSVQQSLLEFGSQVEIVGFFELGSGEHPRVPTAQILETGSSLAEASRRYAVDEVVVAVSERRGGVLPLNDLLECKLAGVSVLDLSSYFESALGQVRLDFLRASWLIFGEGFRHGILRSLAKRISDIVASLVLIALCLPLMLVTAMFVALESGFPILYRQERVGQAGKVFRLVKFRSMRADAEGDGKPRWAGSNDERVTRVGRIIRKLRIDELPQLFNVLKGDMSLVGPRPERAYFVEQLQQVIPFYAARHSVKPGITGWAQVRFRYGASVDDSAKKLQYDLYYVKNHSLFLDLVILVETVGIVLSGKGAQ